LNLGGQRGTFDFVQISGQPTGTQTSAAEFQQNRKEAAGMTAKDDLLALERGFWTGDAEFYRQHLDAVCVTAFTEMAGAFKKDEIAGMIKDSDRWRGLDIDVKAFLEPVPGLALLTYQVRATRKGGEPYAAVVSSGYVKRDGAWKMVLHHQTPLSAAKSGKSA
jgi:hypothetical protein